MQNKTYVPILKAKLGEYGALASLKPEEKDLIVPLLEIEPIPYDFKDKCPRKSVEDHVSKTAKQIIGAWGRKEIWLDTSPVGVADSAKALARCMSSARDLSLRVVPVVRLASALPFLQCAADSIATDNRGAVVRIAADQLDESGFDTTLQQTLAVLGLKPADAHLVIDLGSIGSDARVLARGTQSVVNEFRGLGDWKSFTLASGAFPKNLMALRSEKVARLPRHDLALWRRLTSLQLNREPLYADYGIGHPVLEQLDPRTLTVSGSIRYTTEDDWIIVRGKSIKKEGWGQMVQRCSTLLKETDFEKLSWGDKYIADCAAERAGTGGSTLWRKVGTNRHIVKTLNQLAN